ncbi:hypothetical protein K1T71_010040 [Dendrolimus kikuchii]|uniref:Uncharacterized protein n=1 Tax=Dendrolimus kikuchii TaxID=765133 RepID=A0ACC1CQJ3_9NEOP|nr:hypothetical protein K1T71_010040 [Dendrolimus kikuchii]
MAGAIIDYEEIDKDTVESEILEQQFNKKYTLLTETAVSLKQSYINKLDSTKSLKLAIGLSDNSIEVYQLNNTSLSKVCKFSGHQKGLSEVVCSSRNENIVYSAGSDGVVKMWDTRQGATCAMEYKDEEEQLIRPYECMDVSCNGLVLCAGSQVVQNDAYLVFWDERMSKPLGGYWNSHTCDITQVKFHKEETGILATGALDGLVNVFNVMEQTEDDALTYSLSIENPVERLSWLDSKRVACISHGYDMQVWDADSGDLLRSYGRDKITRSIKRSKEDDCYLVDAFMSIDDTAVLLAGSYSENSNILRSVTITEKKLQPRTDFKGNKQIVRCCWYDKDRDILITAGESGIISVWSGSYVAESGVASKKLSKSLNKLHVNRHQPY